MGALQQNTPELVRQDALSIFSGRAFDESSSDFAHLIGLDVHPDASYTATHYRYCGMSVSRVSESFRGRDREFWHVAGLPVERVAEAEAENFAKAMKILGDATAKAEAKKQRRNKNKRQRKAGDIA